MKSTSRQEMSANIWNIEDNYISSNSLMQRKLKPTLKEEEATSKPVLDAKHQSLRN